MFALARIPSVALLDPWLSRVLGDLLSPLRWPVSTLMGAGSVRQLVARVRAGDREAIDELSQRLECVPAFVRACSRRRGGKLDDAELDDLAQDALMAIWTKLERFDEGRSFEGWVWGFCQREVLAALRTRGRRSGAEPIDAIEPEAPHDGSADPTDEEGLLSRAVDDLGPPASDIVRQRHFDDASFPIIAEELGLPLGTVKTHYYRAVSVLRVRLAALWSEEESS